MHIVERANRNADAVGITVAVPVERRCALWAEELMERLTAVGDTHVFASFAFERHLSALVIDAEPKG